MKKLKAFTLVELIVAIAIFGILMTGIMRLVEPVSSGAVSSKIMNDQKNVENAICSYLGENLRFATNLYIVKGGTASNAVSKFIADEPIDVNGLKITNASKVNVICFDGREIYEYGDSTSNYGGRIIVKKDGKAPSASLYDNAHCDPRGTAGNYYMAMGNSYYQQGDYFLNVKLSGSYLELTVSSDFYTSPGAKSVNVMSCNSSSAGTSGSLISSPVEGVYELMAMGKKPQDSSNAFQFKVMDQNGTEISSGETNVTRTNRNPIYFVYSTEETFD